MMNPEERSTARLRNYVKKNPDRVNDWARETLRRIIIHRLSEAHGNDDTPDSNFTVHDVVKHGGQEKIWLDLLIDSGLAHQVTVSDRGYSRKVVRENLAVFHGMIDELEEKKPVFEPDGADKVNECDIYYALKDLALENLIYIYSNQDEYAFMNKDIRGNRSSSSIYSYGISGLGVIDNDMASEADNASFRNALNDYYSEHMGEVCKMIFKKEAPQLEPIKPKWGSDKTIYDSTFTSTHRSCLPHKKDDISEQYLQFLIEQTEERVEIFQKTLEQLKEMQASLVEAGGDDVFEDLYYQEMIAEFYHNLPFHINSEDKALKRLAERAAKKKYY
jgi:hypothetical protein